MSLWPWPDKKIRNLYFARTGVTLAAGLILGRTVHDLLEKRIAPGLMGVLGCIATIAIFLELTRRMKIIDEKRRR